MIARATVGIPEAEKRPPSLVPLEKVFSVVKHPSMFYFFLYVHKNRIFTWRVVNGFIS